MISGSNMFGDHEAIAGIFWPEILVLSDHGSILRCGERRW